VTSETDSVDLIVTSPPFALLNQKESWLTAAPTRSARLLAKKAIVMLEPDWLRVVWPIEAEGRLLRGYIRRRRSR
jgi:hypothetical protein